MINSEIGSILDDSDSNHLKINNVDKLLDLIGCLLMTLVFVHVVILILKLL